jgi:porin
MRRVREDTMRTDETRESTPHFRQSEPTRERPPRRPPPGFRRGKDTVALLALLVCLTVSAASGDEANPDQTPVTQSSPPSTSYESLESLWTRPRLFEFAARDRWEALGVTFSGDNVNEYLGNLSGGQRHVFDGAGQNALSVNLDLQKLFGWTGGTFVTTYSQRYGVDQAVEAGIPAAQLTNEIFGRGQVTRLTDLHLEQRLFNNVLDIKLGRMPVGSDFQFQRCDFINLTLCGGQPGNIAGDFVYNWPVSQWGAVAKISFLPEWAVRVGVYDRNPLYLNNSVTYAGLPSWPADSIGALIPVELNWTPKFGALPAGDWRIGYMYSTERAPSALTNVVGAPASLADAIDATSYQGRHVFYFSLMQPITGDRNSADPKAGLFVFANGAFADWQTINQTRQINLGLVQRGIGSWRPQDEIGLGTGATTFNPNVASLQGFVNAYNILQGEFGAGAYPKHTEWVAEAFYTIQLTGWLDVKLDAQWIHDPGGFTAQANNLITGLPNRDAALLGFRTTVSF